MFGGRGIQFSVAAQDASMPKVVAVMTVLRWEFLEAVQMERWVMGGAVVTEAIFPSDKFYSPILGTVPRI